MPLIWNVYGVAWYNELIAALACKGAALNALRALWLADLEGLWLWAFLAAMLAAIYSVNLDGN